MTTVYTIGHSNKPLAQFIELLKGAGIKELVDVRSRPQSRFCPWFNKRFLAAELPVAGIAYHWKGNQLGGLDGNVDFAGGIEDVLTMADSLPTAVMCSEGPLKDCHRRYMLTPAFQRMGATVMNISQTGEVTEAPSELSDTPTTDALF